MRAIILQIGQIDASILVFLQNGLKDIFVDAEVGISEAVMPVPLEAYDASRRQYHSTSILARMGKQFRTVGGERLLGVTEADLFVPSLNFVFGEAESPGTAAIISLFRLKPEFYGDQRNDTLFHERALKEAVHETAILLVWLIAKIHCVSCFSQITFK